MVVVLDGAYFNIFCPYDHVYDHDTADFGNRLEALKASAA